MFPRAEAASEGGEWGVQLCSWQPEHRPTRIGHFLESGLQGWAVLVQWPVGRALREQGAHWSMGALRNHRQQL